MSNEVRYTISYLLLAAVGAFSLATPVHADSCTDCLDECFFVWSVMDDACDVLQGQEFLDCVRDALDWWRACQNDCFDGVCAV